MSDDGEGPPEVSRLERSGTRRYRTLTRPGGRRDRVVRQRRQNRVAELLRLVIEQRGLTDEVRQRFVGLYWAEIVGERLASKTEPRSCSGGVLHVSVVSSTWVHEMQFSKARLIAQINGWVETNRAWLGPPPLVTDIRFALGQPGRQRLVEPEHVRRLRARHLQRLRPPREVVPPIVSESDRETILRDTSTVIDSELRALIESVRLKWNR